MGILEMDFERILGVPFFHSSFHSIMLCLKKIKSKRWNNKISRQAKLSNLTKAMISSLSHLWIFKICFWELWNMWNVNCEFYKRMYSHRHLARSTFPVVFWRHTHDTILLLIYVLICTWELWRTKSIYRMSTSCLQSDLQHH